SEKTAELGRWVLEEAVEQAAERHARSPGPDAPHHHAPHGAQRPPDHRPTAAGTTGDARSPEAHQGLRDKRVP
ncbi:hypothetical protein AB0M25_27190, partial [Streptomyces griseomycini]|uniref:hypothetical protein n=1 Tax=Streptomyces griseomycini TaxID=66895 RepID=UPI0034126662